MTDLTKLDITDSAAGLVAGDFTAEGLLAAYLDRIDRFDGTLHAFITVLAEPAMVQARASDERRATGKTLSPLDGIPIGLKDNIDLAGVPTTNGMAKFRDPDQDAEAAHRLREAGAVIIGKLNMHEGALGATTRNLHHGICENPWRIGYTPGGSSGGSASAVAARMCAGALGSDTMGSVRLPAAYCGLSGLKPTFGLISTRGVVPLSYGLDHVGPLCRSSRDLSLMLDVLAGYDPECPESAHPHRALRSDAVNLNGLRFAVPMNNDAVPCEPGIWENFESHVAMLVDQGAVPVDLTLPETDSTGTRRAGLLISEAEAGFALETELAAHPDDFSDDFRKMLEYGRAAPAHPRAKGQHQCHHRSLTCGELGSRMRPSISSAIRKRILAPCALALAAGRRATAATTAIATALQLAANMSQGQGRGAGARGEGEAGAACHT